MDTTPTYQELVAQIEQLRAENKRLQNLNPENEEHTYHALFSHMAEGFARCEMIYANNEAIDFIYLEVNRAFEKHTGLKNVTGKRISEVIPNHKEDNRELFDLYNRVAQSGVSERIESYVAPLDTWFSISVYSSIKGQFLVIFNNITARKKHEEELRESEARFRSLFTQSHVGTAIFDLNHKLLKCNKAFCSFLGFSEEELMGKSFLAFTHPDDQKVGSQEMKEMREGKTDFATVLKRYIRKDGKVVWGELTISLVRDMNNEALYYLPVIQDVTARQKVSQELTEREKKLKELNTTKDKLFSIIAHDLRGPLSNILGFSDLLINNFEFLEQEQTTKYLGYISLSTKNTVVLLDNLLDWAKTQTGTISFKPQNTDLATLVQLALKMVSAGAQAKDISLRYANIENIKVHADENMINTVLRNLVSNAIKFTNKGGEIEIGATVHQNVVEVWVSDNGVGISTEKQKNIFSISSKAYSLGTAKEKGTGLGLILCAEFIERHKGKIWVESTEGKGSSFRFTLPRAF